MTKNNKEDDKELNWFLLFLIIGVPIILFLIVNYCVSKDFFSSYFLNDNVLLYYGAIVGSCISGAITYVGLYYTFKHNNENLKKQTELFSNQVKLNDLKVIRDNIIAIRDSINILYNIANPENRNIRNESLSKYIEKMEINYKNIVFLIDNENPNGEYILDSLQEIKRIWSSPISDCYCFFGENCETIHDQIKKDESQINEILVKLKEMKNNLIKVTE